MRTRTLITLMLLGGFLGASAQTQEKEKVKQVTPSISEKGAQSIEETPSQKAANTVEAEQLIIQRRQGQNLGVIELTPTQRKEAEKKD